MEKKSLSEAEKTAMVNVIEMKMDFGDELEQDEMSLYLQICKERKKKAVVS